MVFKLPFVSGKSPFNEIQGNQTCGVTGVYLFNYEFKKGKNDTNRFDKS